jgi:hypothetical protein
LIRSGLIDEKGIDDVCLKCYWIIKTENGRNRISNREKGRILSKWEPCGQRILKKPDFRYSAMGRNAD